MGRNMHQEPGVPLDDLREVSNYVAALDHGLRLILQPCIKEGADALFGA